MCTCTISGDTCLLLWCSSWISLNIPESCNELECILICNMQSECIPSSSVHCPGPNSENRYLPTLIHMLNWWNFENKSNYYSVFHCRQYGLLATLLETALCAETMFWTVISCPLYCSKCVLIYFPEFCFST